MIKFKFLFIYLILLNACFAKQLWAACSNSEVLLLHSNGTDASTTFTDSSASAHSMTANGNAQIDTAQSKFGGASGLYDGTGDYLSTTDHADWDLGTGDFTIDFWIRLNTDFATDTKFVHTVLAPDTNDTWLVLAIDDENNLLRLVLFPNTRTFAFSPTKNTWYHIALTRSGTDLRAFVDGTQIGVTATDSTDVLASSAIFVGSDHVQTASQMTDGWIEELRIVKGTAVWTANFTPETTEYCSAQRRIMLIE